MPDKYPMTTTVEGARRIERAVRNVLGSADRSGDRQDGARKADETCWGKITSKVTDGYEWKEQGRKIGSDNKPTWGDIDGGRSGDNSKDDAEKNLAIGVAPNANPVLGSVVMLRRSTTLAKKASPSDPDVWLARWVIVAPLGAVHVKCTSVPDVYGSVVGAKVIDPDTAALVGDEVTVYIIHHTSVDDDFYAFPLSVNSTGTPYYVQFGYPKLKSQFTVLQRMDAVGGTGQSIDWDFVKGHP